jgi:hypothetical protein
MIDRRCVISPASLNIFMVPSLSVQDVLRYASPPRFDAHLRPEGAHHHAHLTHVNHWHFNHPSSTADWRFGLPFCMHQNAQS